MMLAQVQFPMYKIIKAAKCINVDLKDDPEKKDTAKRKNRRGMNTF